MNGDDNILLNPSVENKSENSKKGKRLGVLSVFGRKEGGNDAGN